MTTPRTQARLIYSASESDANMLWATGFFAPDPFIFIEKNGKRYLVMSDLEMDRARDQAHVDKVLSYSLYARRLLSEGGPQPPVADVISEVLSDLKISAVDVPATFPLGVGDALRQRRIHVTPVADPF